MKIAVITNSFTEPRRLLFERVSKEYGHDITVFKHADWWWEDSPYLCVRKWRGFHIDLPFRKGSLYLHFDFRTLVALLKDPWAVIIAYGYGGLMTLPAVLIAKARGIPFLLFSDARLEYEATRSPLIMLAKKAVHAFVDEFMASGKSAKLALEAQGISRNKVKIIPYAIDNEEAFRSCLSWKSRASETKAELQVAEETRIVLFVGRVERNKGVIPLIQGFLDLSRDVSDVVLVLVGEIGLSREDINWVNRNADDTVRLVGSVNHRDIWKYYAISDLLILPSFRDVWGLVVNEAMACGLPIVASKEVGAVRDLVRHGFNGMVINPTPEEIYLALREIIIDERRRSEMATRSRWIIDGYDLNRSVLCLQEILSGLPV
jgi:glycosyltransferase involved in cell wall biosynthesis